MTRRIGETIRIGDEVCVTVLAVKGSQARIGITAPTTVEVHREEIYQRIAQERAAPPEAATARPGGAPATVTFRKPARKIETTDD